jgi:hypothetical protein
MFAIQKQIQQKGGWEVKIKINNVKNQTLNHFNFLSAGGDPRLLKTHIGAAQ